MANQPQPVRTLEQILEEIEKKGEFNPELYTKKEIKLYTTELESNIEVLKRNNESLKDTAQHAVDEFKKIEEAYKDHMEALNENLNFIAQESAHSAKTIKMSLMTVNTKMQI